MNSPTIRVNKNKKPRLIRRLAEAGQAKIKTKMQNTANFSTHAFEHGGWKYYNTIKKKAMEQEFSWSGLLVSLSIAFFVVLACAQALSVAYNTIERARIEEKPVEQKIYQLESVNHINIQAIDSIKYLELRRSPMA